MSYQIWIFTTSGKKTAYIENAFNIERVGKMNQTPTLSFSLPTTDAKTIYLTAAYEIKIYNTIKSRWEGLYVIDDAEDGWGSSGSVVNVNYSGAMAQLASEESVSYDTSATADPDVFIDEPKTPTQVITGLLALQGHVPAITVGTIQPTLPLMFAVENGNLLAAILECVAYAGGYIEVDADRHLNWYNEPSGLPVREVRYRKNMKGVSRKSDFTQICNRLYAYGAGETDAQLTLGDVVEFTFDNGGHLNGGVEPAIFETFTKGAVHCELASISLTSGSWAAGTAAGTMICTPLNYVWDGDWTTGYFNASVAGTNTANTVAITKQRLVEYVESIPAPAATELSIKRLTIASIVHPVTLLRYARQYVATYKDPVYFYKVDVVNLAEHADFEFDFEELVIGQIVRVINSDLNDLNVNVKIVAVSLNLSEPENISIELANVTPNLADSFADLKSTQNLAQNVAVSIGAGQVVVQGVFTVDGWRTSGTTTIDGGNITANTITVTKLNFTPIQGGSIITTINSTAEAGFVISGARITISGSTTFDSGYNPTDKTAKVGGTYDSAASGARVRLFPDTSTGILITDGTHEVFKALVAGSDVGDVIIGNYTAGGSGAKWDQSAGTFTIAGILEATEIKSNKTLTVNGAIQSSNYNSGVTGFRLSALGDVDVRNVTIYGAIATVGNVDSIGNISCNNLTSLYSLKISSTLSDGSAGNGTIYTTNGLNLHWKDQSGGIHFFAFT